MRSNAENRRTSKLAQEIKGEDKIPDLYATQAVQEKPQRFNLILEANNGNIYIEFKAAEVYGIPRINHIRHSIIDLMQTLGIQEYEIRSIEDEEL